MALLAVAGIVVVGQSSAPANCSIPSAPKAPPPAAPTAAAATNLAKKKQQLQPANSSQVRHHQNGNTKPVRDSKSISASTVSQVMPSQLPRRCSWRPKLGGARQKQTSAPLSALAAPATSVGKISGPGLRVPGVSEHRRSASSCSAPPSSTSTTTTTTTAPTKTMLSHTNNFGGSSSMVSSRSYSPKDQQQQQQQQQPPTSLPHLRPHYSSTSSMIVSPPQQQQQQQQQPTIATLPSTSNQKQAPSYTASRQMLYSGQNHQTPTTMESVTNYRRQSNQFALSSYQHHGPSGGQTDSGQQSNNPFTYSNNGEGQHPRSTLDTNSTSASATNNGNNGNNNNNHNNSHQQYANTYCSSHQAGYSKPGYILATAPPGTIVASGVGRDLAAAAMGSPPKSKSHLDPALDSAYTSQGHYSSTNNQQYSHYHNGHNFGHQPDSGPASLSSSLAGNHQRYRARSPSMIATSSSGLPSQYGWYQPQQYNNSSRLDDNYQGVSLAAAVRRSNSLKAGSCLDMSQFGTTPNTNNSLLTRHYHLISGTGQNSSGAHSSASSRAPSPPLGGLAQTGSTNASGCLGGLEEKLLAQNSGSHMNQTSGYAQSPYHQPGSIKLALSSSAAFVSEAKVQHELRKLQRELDSERDKNTALSSQLNINSGLMAAFEQSLSTLNNRLHQLTALTDKKDKEIETLKQKVQMYKQHHKSCQFRQNNIRDDQKYQDDGIDMSMGHLSDTGNRQTNDMAPRQGVILTSTGDIIVSNSSDLSTASSTSSASSAESSAYRQESNQEPESSSSLVMTDDLIALHSPVESHKRTCNDNDDGNDDCRVHSISNHGDTNNNDENGNKITDQKDNYKNKDAQDPVGTQPSDTDSEFIEKKYNLAQKKIEELERQLREKDRQLTDSRLESLTAAHQLEQLEASMGDLHLDRRQKRNSIKVVDDKRRSKTPDYLHEYSNLDEIGASIWQIKSPSPDS